MPASNKAFWRAKFEENVARDRRVRRQLQRLHWHTLTVWECQTAPDRVDSLIMRIDGFLRGDLS